MDVTLLFVLLFFSLSILFLGFFKKQSVLIIFSGIAFFLIGILLFGYGISFVSGSVDSYNYVCSQSLDLSCELGNSTSIGSLSTVDSISYLHDDLIIGWGIFFMLFAIFLWIVSAINLMSGKGNSFDFDDDVDSGEE